MGMDVYGLNPQIKSEEPQRPTTDDYQSPEWADFQKKHEAWQEENAGVYFRNNVWWWRPLWDYVNQVCSKTLSETDYEAGHCNSGYEINKEQCKEISRILAEELLSGRTKEYKEAREKTLKALPLVQCVHCNGTGQRNDEVVQGECNGCTGKGEVKHFDTSYPFDIDNVVQFQKFVCNSGGFAIS